MNFILNRSVSLMFSITTNCQKRTVVAAVLFAFSVGSEHDYGFSTGLINFFDGLFMILGYLPPKSDFVCTYPKLHISRKQILHVLTA